MIATDPPLEGPIRGSIAGSNETSIDVVVGAGFSGTVTCVHLLRLRAAEHARLHGNSARPKVVLIERSVAGPVGPGVAYSSTYGVSDGPGAPLLNVPAGMMSAFPDDEEHFVRWARALEPSVDGATFATRPRYGRYLTSLLDDAERETREHVELVRVTGEACAFDTADAPRRVRVRLTDGRLVDGSSAVIALGSPAPEAPRSIEGTLARSERYTNDPWASSALSSIPNEGDILLVGTGLTMMDVAALLAGRDRARRVYAISRRGLVPQPHRLVATRPATRPRPLGLDAWPRSVRGMLRALRAEIALAHDEGFDWRDVVASLRRDTADLWRSLSVRERARFLRHARPYWETHRHRAAPPTAERVAKLVADGTLVVIAGRIVSARDEGGVVTIGIRERRTSRERTLEVAHVINCTGPGADVRAASMPLVKYLLESGLARTDALGLGLETSANGALVDAQGRASDALFVVGPARKGELWEHTAVPELRVAARETAEALVRSCPISLVRHAET